MDDLIATFGEALGRLKLATDNQVKRVVYGTQKTAFTRENLRSLPKAFCVAQEMGA